MPARVGVALALLASSCTGGADRTTPSPSRTLHPTGPGQGQVVPTIRLHGRLAFSYEHDHNVDVYVMDLPAGTLHRLTTSPGADFSPTWSPDGKQIAFRSDRKGNDEVFVRSSS